MQFKAENRPIRFPRPISAIWISDQPRRKNLFCWIKESNRSLSGRVAALLSKNMQTGFGLRWNQKMRCTTFFCRVCSTHRTEWRNKSNRFMYRSFRIFFLLFFVWLACRRHFPRGAFSWSSKRMRLAGDQTQAATHPMISNRDRVTRLKQSAYEIAHFLPLLSSSHKSRDSFDIKHFINLYKPRW